MKIKMRQLAQDDSGVAMVLSLMFSLFIFLTFLAIFSLGQNIQRKISLQTAVDNVAYAGALAEADTLSKLAVVNRAIAWTYVMNNRRHVDYVMQRFGMDILRAFWFDSTEAAIQQTGMSISASGGQVIPSGTGPGSWHTEFNGGVCPWHNAGYYCNDTDMAQNTFASSIIEANVAIAPPRMKPFFRKDLDNYDNRYFFTDPTFIENVTLSDIVNHIPNVEGRGATWDLNVHNYETLISSLSQAGANNPVTIFNLSILQNFFDNTDLGQLMHATLDLYAAQHSWYDRLEGFFANANGMEDRQYGVGKHINPNLYWAGPMDVDQNLLTAEPLPEGTYTNWIRHGHVRSNTKDFDIRNLFYLIYDEYNRAPYQRLEAEIIQGSRTLEALNQAAETLVVEMDKKIHNAMKDVAQRYRAQGIAFNVVIGGKKYTDSSTPSNGEIAHECFYIPDENLFFRYAANGSTNLQYDDSIPRNTYRDTQDQTIVDADGWQSCQSWWNKSTIIRDENSPQNFANRVLGFRRLLNSTRLTSGDWSSYAYMWQCFGGVHKQAQTPKPISNRDGNSVRAGFYPNTCNPYPAPQAEIPDNLSYRNDYWTRLTWDQWLDQDGNRRAAYNFNMAVLVVFPGNEDALAAITYLWAQWIGHCNSVDAHNAAIDRENESIRSQKQEIENQNITIREANAVYESWYTTFPKHYGSVTTPWRAWENTDGLCNYDRSATARPVHTNHRLFSIFGSIVVSGSQSALKPLGDASLFGQAFKGSNSIWAMSAARAGYRLPQRIRNGNVYPQAPSGTYQSLWSEPDMPETIGYETDWNLMVDDWDVVMLPLNKAWKIACTSGNGLGTWITPREENDYTVSTNTGDHYETSDLTDILKEITGQNNQSALREIIKYVLH